jgi:predicted ATPase
MSVLTFLFTDIEGSTRRWESDADAMRSALEAHNKTLRSAVESNGGKVFNYTGDGMCAAFESPRSAVDAAVDAQRALELPVRMGIATGEAALRDGEYSGTVLNRTARVMAAGHGGQILTDGATAELLTGVSLIDMGQRQLRDIAKMVHLFQVQGPGLRVNFPPLKTLEAAPGNLRIPSTSFHGREEDIAELQTALKKHRLVTLSGPGGVGKTRLAFETAGRLAQEYPDGVFVVELASVTDPRAVPDAVAAVLGITQQPGMNVTDSVATALQDRLRLLVFDNCEHVIDAAADIVEAILARSTTVTVLATSREGLRAADELLWPVPSLEVEAGPQSAAARLFVERAGVVRGVSPVDDDDAVVEICRRLDGIPLAIELAASRLMSMTVTEVRDRLDDRFRLLVGSRRGLERHQTLQHAVQWSYDLLDSDEKSLLTRCSVFVGGFDLAAAVAVASTGDEFSTLDILDALVRKSLVIADRARGHTRFFMLETIRQFAEGRLIESGDADALRSAHARYFASREGDILALWDSPRQREAYEWLAVEMANLRTAFRWSVDREDLDSAAAIAHCAGFIGFWSERHEPIRWSEELVAPARAVQHRRLAQLCSIAVLCFTAGRIDDAVAYSAVGQEAVRSGRFDEVRNEAKASLASPYAAIGEIDRWVDWCRYVIGSEPEPHLHTRGVFTLALKMSGADEEAVAASRDLLAAADTADNPNLAAWALFAFGGAHRTVAPAAAYDAFRRGLRIAHDSGSLQTESSIASMLTVLATDHGEPADALNYSAISIRYYYDSGNFYLVKNTLATLAALFDRVDRPETAAIVSGFADSIFARASYPEFASVIAHLRDVLGDTAYDSFARQGKDMSSAAVVEYTLEQIDRARAELQRK